MANGDNNLELNEIADLLLLSESELDVRILADLNAISPPPIYKGWIFPDDDSLEAGITLGGIPDALETPMAAIKIDPLQIYVKGKKYIFSLPGEKAADLIRTYSKDGGLSFCGKFDYCKQKASLRNKFVKMQNYSEEAAPILELGVDRFTKHFPDDIEWLVSIREGINSAIEDFADVAFPGTIFIKVLKYGMDDLCPCCKPCRGLGVRGNINCSHCNGDGFREPFVCE